MSVGLENLLSGITKTEIYNLYMCAPHTFVKGLFFIL